MLSQNDTIIAMFGFLLTQALIEGKVRPVKLVQAPKLFITDRSKAVVLLWFSVACVSCQSFGDVSLYVCSYYFSSVWVAEWPHFGKVMPNQLTICSLYFDYL